MIKEEFNILNPVNGWNGVNTKIVWSDLSATLNKRVTQVKMMEIIDEMESQAKQGIEKNRKNLPSILDGGEDRDVFIEKILSDFPAKKEEAMDLVWIWHGCTEQEWRNKLAFDFYLFPVVLTSPEHLLGEKASNVA